MRIQSRTYSKSQNIRQRDCLVQVLITDDETVPPKGSDSSKMDIQLNVLEGIKKTIPDSVSDRSRYTKLPVTPSNTTPDSLPPNLT